MTDVDTLFDEITGDNQPTKLEETPVKEQETPESPPPGEEEQIMVPIAAVHDLRRKVVSLKQENESLRQYAPKEEEPDPYEDLEKYKQYVRNKVISEITQGQREQHQAFVEAARQKMFETHPDFQKMEKLFIVMAQDEPGLVNEMLASRDPAQFAYDKAVTYKKELLAAEREEEPPKQKSRLPNLATATAQRNNSQPIAKMPDVYELFDD